MLVLYLAVPLLACESILFYRLKFLVCESIRFFRLKFLVSPTEKNRGFFSASETRSLSRKNRMLSQAMPL